MPLPLLSWSVSSCFKAVKSTVGGEFKPTEISKSLPCTALPYMNGRTPLVLPTGHPTTTSPSLMPCCSALALRCPTSGRCGWIRRSEAGPSLLWPQRRSHIGPLAGRLPRRGDHLYGQQCRRCCHEMKQSGGRNILHQNIDIFGY